MESLDREIQGKVNNWLNGNYDEDTKAALREKLNNGKYEELTDAFYKDLEFGTGGIRGIMGVGSNRVNKYTLGMATQGLSNFLNKNYPDEQVKVAIAHDCRNNSETLSQVVADVFSANGIHVYLFDGLRPTPELSFAIRELDCHGGVMLTASHNPKEYNGYKAYGADGGQLVSPYDKQVMEEVQKIESIDEVKFEGNPKHIERIGKEIDEKYLDAIAQLSISRDAIKRQKDLKIVFSPIHGTAGVIAPPALKRYGFENVTLVEEQMEFNGDFPTVEYPNPEEKEALTLALNKAKEIDAELVMATDPDADRVGIAVKNTKGEWTLLNGNQTGTLLINYMLNAWKEAGKLTGNEYIVKTIVTSYLIDRIAKEYGVECYNTLTGFKYIGELMTKFEGKKKFIAGGEESYGYLVGEHVRDKDAIVSSTIIAEMTAYYKDKGSSLFEALLDMYVEHGYFREKLVSVYKRGKTGAEEIQKMLKNYRNNPPKKLAGSKVVVIKDYKTGKEKNIKTGKTSDIDLPSSNVLQFVTEDGSIVSVRPSGTEPKIKFYCSVNTDLESRAKFEATTKKLESKMDQIIKELTE
ncbi:phospho-sugar mutase [Aliifodinibius sp. S!AR15-10]|uniref:phospho-sugar mutase n=1 Tax=Aliifodinibius sp. S!AR15-10 TaxID=2950437 RepID=UPI002858CB71|nr:phospho-sugar mutase [Aliifodinibius sp. S!AR15-10]MDR8393278.1 phospho-sugar mutase [Aliifodinibius sp. S!AR15-10]